MCVQKEDKHPDSVRNLKNTQESVRRLEGRVSEVVGGAVGHVTTGPHIDCQPTVANASRRCPVTEKVH